MRLSLDGVHSFTRTSTIPGLINPSDAGRFESMTWLSSGSHGRVIGFLISLSAEKKGGRVQSKKEIDDFPSTLTHKSNKSINFIVTLFGQEET